jgi:hypothetical protein
MSNKKEYLPSKPIINAHLCRKGDPGTKAYLYQASDVPVLTTGTLLWSAGGVTWQVGSRLLQARLLR